MKKTSILLILFFTLNLLSAQEKPTLDYTKNYETIMKRTQWWRDARFGMLITFGAYAVAARGEWVKSDEKLTTEQYQKYVDAFNPVDFDAREWAKTAKAAGMKYAVLTARHHDGFCLFNSKLTDYKLSKQIGGRDLVREFLEAFRSEGLKVGLYYSIIDWYHPDYPNVGNHPQRNDKEYAKRNFNWDNYLKFMFGQVEELTTNYGKIDIMWFDYSFPEYSGEKWKAKELVKMVRKNQPDIILNNRLEVNAGVVTAARTINELGDFETPEQGIPENPLFDKYNNPVPWETCLTMNNIWGYNELDNNWKSPELIIHSLVNCVSKNGNFMLNVGPDARGNFPTESVNILTEVGKWMEKNGESIYGCGASPLKQQEWGRYTQKDNLVFAHWMHTYLGNINAKGIQSDSVKNVIMLHSGAELTTSKTRFGDKISTDNLFIRTGNTPQKPYKHDTVIKIQYKL